MILNPSKYFIAIAATLILMTAGCSKSESYSDLLRDEERAVNWYLAQHRVEIAVPEDSVFEIGPDAPFYRMNEDGTIYMQVLSEGNPADKPKEGERVYFRFMRQNLKYMYEGVDVKPEGNMDNFNVQIGPTNFIMGNKIYPNTTKYGSGIQLPMTYLGYFSEVNLVLKSYAGFPENQSECTPYVMNIKYYKSEY
ncbi:MAG: DUF4827 domain-containing protein [Muribaculaceae bacterium]|nr:DUF4827 domain-containing protein [Muribaculaceae bacterium]